MALEIFLDMLDIWYFQLRDELLKPKEPPPPQKKTVGFYSIIFNRQLLTSAPTHTMGFWINHQMYC